MRFASLACELVAAVQPVVAMIVQPGESDTRPHIAGWVPHPSGHITPAVRGALLGIILGLD